MTWATWGAMAAGVVALVAVGWWRIERHGAADERVEREAERAERAERNAAARSAPMPTRARRVRAALRELRRRGVRYPRPRD